MFESGYSYCDHQDIWVETTPDCTIVLRIPGRQPLMLPGLIRLVDLLRHCDRVVGLGEAVQAIPVTPTFPRVDIGAESFRPFKPIASVYRPTIGSGEKKPKAGDADDTKIV